MVTVILIKLSLHHQWHAFYQTLHCHLDFTFEAPRSPHPMIMFNGIGNVITWLLINPFSPDWRNNWNGPWGASSCYGNWKRRNSDFGEKVDSMYASWGCERAEGSWFHFWKIRLSLSFGGPLIFWTMSRAFKEHGGLIRISSAGPAEHWW